MSPSRRRSGTFYEENEILTEAEAAMDAIGRRLGVEFAPIDQLGRIAATARALEEVEIAADQLRATGDELSRVAIDRDKQQLRLQTYAQILGRAQYRDPNHNVATTLSTDLITRNLVVKAKAVNLSERRDALETENRGRGDQIETLARRAPTPGGSPT